MEVVFRYGLGVVTGTIESKQEDRGPAHIVLVPQDRPYSQAPLFGEVDQANRFSMKLIPPGVYRAYALESIDFAALRDPIALKALRSLGTEITVGENEQQSIVLPIISALEQRRALDAAQ